MHHQQGEFVTGPPHAPPDNAVSTLQIIVGALLMGVLIFAVVAFFVGRGRDHDQAGVPVMTYMSVPFAAAALMGYLVVPRLLTSHATPVCNRDDADGEISPSAYAPIFQTKTIVACALVEGAAFFALVTFIIEGNYLSFGVAAAMVLAILFQFPTRSGVRQWCEDQARRAREMRSLERR